MLCSWRMESVCSNTTNKPDLNPPTRSRTFSTVSTVVDLASGSWWDTTSHFKVNFCTQCNMHHLRQRLPRLPRLWWDLPYRPPTRSELALLSPSAISKPWSTMRRKAPSLSFSSTTAQSSRPLSIFNIQRTREAGECASRLCLLCCIISCLSSSRTRCEPRQSSMDWTRVHIQVKNESHFLKFG